MLKYFLSFLLLPIVFQASGQIGLNAGYRQNLSSEWPDFFNKIYETDEVILKSGYTVGVDYWFKALKNTRLEMMPELSYSHFNTELREVQNGNEAINITADIFSFEWKVNLYPLDLEGDCNCPTFSKDGDIVKKGFFFQVAPGVHYFSNKVKGQQLEESSSSIAGSLAVGLGLDLGISDFMTLSPIVKAYFIPAAKWNSDDLTAVVPDEILDHNKTNLLQLYVGVRLGLRFDEMSRY